MTFPSFFDPHTNSAATVTTWSCKAHLIEWNWWRYANLFHTHQTSIWWKTRMTLSLCFWYSTRSWKAYLFLRYLPLFENPGGLFQIELLYHGKLLLSPCCTGKSIKEFPLSSLNCHLKNRSRQWRQCWRKPHSPFCSSILFCKKGGIHLSFGPLVLWELWNTRLCLPGYLNQTMNEGALQRFQIGTFLPYRLFLIQQLRSLFIHVSQESCFWFS